MKDKKVCTKSCENDDTYKYEYKKYVMILAQEILIPQLII